jgi:hypothetical protein
VRHDDEEVRDLEGGVEVMVSISAIDREMLTAPYNAPHNPMPRHSNGSRSSAVLAFLILCVLGPVAALADESASHRDCPAGQMLNDAGVCEDMESVLSETGDVYWVAREAPNASDSNPGTKTQPWMTIGRAINQLGAGDAVIVRNGVYRESIRPRSGGTSPSRRITFAAYTGEEVVISGAQPINSGWTNDSGKWRHTWTVSLPAEAVNPAHPLLPFRREMVIVDGQPLRAVASLAEVVPGRFYVQGPPGSPTAIYMRTPQDDNPSNHFVEAARRDLLFAPDNANCGGNSVGDSGYLRVIGFVFKYAASEPQRGAICIGPWGSLLEDTIAEHNAAIGYKIYGSDHDVLRNVSRYNGQAGIGGSCQNCLFAYNESRGNNTDGFLLFYESGGGKFTGTTGTTIRGHVAIDNEGHGLWFDNDNHGNTVEKSFFIRNLGSGVHLELDTTNTVVRNNVIYGQRYIDDGLAQGDGILSHSASYNKYYFNTIMHNEGYGIRIKHETRAPCGYNKAYNNLLIANAYGYSTHGEPVREISISSDTLNYLRTNDLDGNFYWSHAGGNEFNNSTFFASWNGTQVRTNNISLWRSTMNGDQAGAVLVANQPHVVDYTSPSGWRLVDDSQVIGMATSLPAGDVVATDLDGDPRPSADADVGADQLAAAPPGSSVLGEAGVLTQDQPTRAAWHAASFQRAYNNPVVVASLSFRGAQGATVRVRGVTPTGFEYRIEEWMYLDGRHGDEDIRYLVVEAGTHVLADGSVVQAGFSDVSSVDATVSFNQSFTALPTVVAGVVTDNDPTTVTLRLTDFTLSSVVARLQNEEALGPHGFETVGWIAVNQGAGSLSSGQLYDSFVTGAIVSDEGVQVPFSQAFSANPVVIGTCASLLGGDPVSLRLSGLSTTGVTLWLQEEQSRDPETSHGNERAAIIAVTQGMLDY